MGCFLGCFGFSGKQRHRKPANKGLSRDHRLASSYEPLDSSVENTRDSDSQLSCSNKIKERSSIKIGKKVSFNLNIQTYEPLKNEETTYQLSESDEEEKREKNGEEELAKGSLSFVSERDSTILQMGAFPSNHRYRNCRYSYDDDDDNDDIAYIESDFDEGDDEWDGEFEDDYDDDDDEHDIDDQRISRNDFLKELNNQSVESPERNKINNRMQLHGSTTDGDSKSIESEKNARHRRQYLNSVLNPVENLTQWKAVKARTAVLKHPTKENIGLHQEAARVPFDLKPNGNQSKRLLQEISVESSLSNWLASPNCEESKTRSIIKSSNFSVENIPLTKSVYDKSCSHQSREIDQMIDIVNNLKAK